MLILRNSVIRSPRHLVLLLSQIQFLLEHIFEKEKKTYLKDTILVLNFEHTLKIPLHCTLDKNAIIHDLAVYAL